MHIYAHNTAEALEEAFQTYLHAKMKAIDNKIPLAPVDGKKNLFLIFFRPLSCFFLPTIFAEYLTSLVPFNVFLFSTLVTYSFLACFISSIHADIEENKY